LQYQKLDSKPPVSPMGETCDFENPQSVVLFNKFLLVMKFAWKINELKQNVSSGELK
jgi:hypothetical protein